MEGELFCAVKPLLRLSKALGLAPFDVPSLERSERCLTYSRVLVVAMVALIVLLTSLACSVQQQCYSKISFATVSSFILLYMPIQAIKDHRLAIRIIEEINVIDILLKSLRVTIPYKQNKLLVLVILLPLYLDFFVLGIRGVSTFFQGAFFTTILSIPLTMRYVVPLQFIVSVMAAKQRRRLYNEALLNLACTSQHVDRATMSQSDIDITWSGRVMSHRRVVRHRSYQTVLLGKWKTLAKINKTLLDCVVNINTYYSITMLVVIASLVISIPYTLLVKPRRTFFGFASSIPSHIIMLSAVPILLTNCAVCSYCAEEFDRTSVAAYRLLNNSDLAVIKGKLSNLLVGCIYRKPKFACAGLFYIDYTLIPSIIGVVLTIIVQMQGTRGQE